MFDDILKIKTHKEERALRYVEANRDIVKLKEQELEYIQQLENLRQEVLQVRDELEAARAAHRQAQANVQKYEEIIKEVDAEHKKEAERQEDLELEGVMARPGHTEM
ncbi:MAG: YscO family type III secretion system apparatus protein [Gammaproteobacteria bacterium]